MIADLFESAGQVQELQSLGERPTAYWYVSAGEDFRGPVFISDFLMRKRNGISIPDEIIIPEVFIYNCLGEEVQALRRKLGSDGSTLFEDGSTLIKGKNFIPLRIDRNYVRYAVNPAYVAVGHVKLPLPGKDAFYFEVEVVDKSSGHMEVQKVIYFEQENINFFEEVILEDVFDVKYLCATCEGLAMGNCKKSIAQHIYRDGNPHFYRQKQFKPDYFIALDGTAADAFEQNTAKVPDLEVRLTNLIYPDNSIINSYKVFRIKYKNER